MELTSSRSKTALATTGQEPWALAIRKSYGNLPAFATKFSPAVQKYCAQNMLKAVENDLPTFGRIVSTYGEEGVGALVATHMTDAILRMGEDRDVDPHDVQFIAEAICQSDRFKTLRFTTVIGFFHFLKCGEFDIYGKVTPRKILEAFRKYAIEAQAKENRIAYEKDCREAEAAREQARAHSVTWEQYAAANDIKDPSFAAYLARTSREHIARRDFWKNLADMVKKFSRLIAYIAIELKKHPQTAGNGKNSD